MTRNSRLQQRRGFSLIETIMVITVLAAAATTGLFLLDSQWVARRTVTAVANDIANTLVAARDSAITNQTTVSVRRVRRGGNESLVVTEQAGPFRPGNNWTIDLGADVRVGGSPTEVRFAPTGSANRNLNWAITQSRTSASVSVAPASGQVMRRLP